MLLADLAWAVVPFNKNSYSTPPVPTKETTSPKQILIVAAAVTAPAFAVKPGTGKALTETKISFEDALQVTPFLILTTCRR